MNRNPYMMISGLSRESVPYKASGSDAISQYVLKRCIQTLSGLLETVRNSLEEGSVESGKDQVSCQALRKATTI